MKSIAITLFIKAFGGRIASVIAAGIVWLIFAAVGKLASFSPELAATIDCNQLANWAFSATLIGINAVSNHFHLTALEPLQADMQKEQGTLAVPVKRAEPVK